MKKWVLILLVLLSVGFAKNIDEDCPCANDKKIKKHTSLDYHFGGGYSAVFLQDNINFPLGFMGYAGIGFRFNRILSAGLEYEFEYAKSFDLRVSKAYALGHLPKVYLKFKVADFFAINTTLGGGLYRYADQFEGRTRNIDYNSLMLGLRGILFFVYGQVNITNDIVQLGAGLSFSM